MGSQVRLVHALGQKVLALTPRSFDEPFVIGRAKDADLQVPSVTLPLRHCVLFVHDGRWVVQDAGSEAGTFVNGLPITQPRLLNAGDVISLGSGPDAPTLVIEPLGAATTSSAAPVVATLVASEPAYVASVVAAPEESYDLADDGSASGRHAMANEPEAAVDPAWGAPALGEKPKRQEFYVPKQRGLSGGAIAGAVIVVIVLLALGGYLVHIYQEKSDEAATPVVVAPPVAVLPPEPKTPSKGDSIFDLAPARPKRAPVPVAPAPVATPSPAPRIKTVDQNGAAADAPAAPDAPVDPEKQTEDWLQIETARLGDPVLLVTTCDRYLDDHGQTKFKSEIEGYKADAVDMIWWNRVRELCQQRDSLKEEVATANDELKQSTDAAFRKTRTAERDSSQAKLTAAIGHLKTDMGYNIDSAPNPQDSAQLTKLRAQRDPALFEQFQKDVLASIHRTRDRLPWQSH